MRSTLFTILVLCCYWGSFGQTAPISGTASVCAGAVTSLTNSVSGGTWASAHPGIATVGSTGVVHGIAAGTATISYTTGGGTVTATATVLPLPSPGTISGVPSISLGRIATLSASVAGGTWSSSTTGIATISSTGVAHAVSGGLTIISYSMTNGCGTVAATRALAVDEPTAGRRWATYYGGTGHDDVTSIATDAWGNVYITGGTYSTTGRATAGAHQTTFGGDLDGYIAKYNSAGTLLWSTYYGGSGYDYPASVASDAAGNVYVTGATTSTSGIATSGAHQSSFYGSVDGFLAKFDSAGVLQWGTYYLACEGVSVTADAFGNVYMAAGFASSSGAPSGITTSGAHQETHANLMDAVLIKFNGAGVRQWATFYGDFYEDKPVAVKTDVYGNVYLAGDTHSEYNIATSGVHMDTHWGFPHDISFPMVEDVFLVKFDSFGVRQWGTYYGGDGYDNVKSLAIDAAGNVYMAGGTGSSSGIATFGAHQTSFSSGIVDGFLTKFNSAGTQLWGTYYGGADMDFASSIAVDDLGNVSLFGITQSTSAIATSGAYKTTTSGTAEDAFLVHFDSSGVRQSATYFGGSAPETQIVGAVAAQGAVYMAGLTQSGAEISTIGSHQENYGTGTDGFLVRMGFPTPPITGVMTLCGGTTTTLSNAVPGGTWSSSNTTVATVGASIGTVYGVSGGTALITYSASLGIAVDTVTVAAPATISGSPIICPPTRRTYSATEPGGTWSSSDAHIFVHSSTGEVVSFGTGPATITYTTTSGCVSTLTVSVGLPVISGGSGILCVGSSTTFSGSPAGGRWTSGYITNASIDSITGVTLGLGYAVDVPIYYTMYPGCSSTTTVTVNPPLPDRIYGNAYLCPGQEVTLSDASAGGSWSSSNTGICTVSSTGIVTGVAQGYSLLSYTTTTTCGPSSAVKNIYVGQPMKWDWATTGGGVLNDIVQSKLITDSAGNSYMAGTFRGVATFGTYTVSAGLATQGFLIKYNNSGNCVWARQFGLGGYNDLTYFTSLSMDGMGNLYLGGLNKWFSGTMDTFGADIMYGSTGERMFVVKYDGNGNEIWARQAISGVALPATLAADASGNVFVSGESRTAIDFGSGVSVSGSNLNYVIKYNTSGTPQWVCEYVTSTNYTSIFAMATDQAGNCFILGNYGTPTFTTFNTVPSTTTFSQIGNSDGFVGMINPTGQLKWVDGFGGPVPSFYPFVSITQPHSIVADNYGNCYITGLTTASITIGSTPITVATRSGGTSFLAKYDTSGHPIWATQATVSVFGDNSSQGLCLNGNQEPVIAGVYFGDMSFDTVNLKPISTDFINRQDLYVAQFDTAGGCKWGINATTTGTYPQCNGLARDASGNLYLTGNVAGTSEFGCNNTTAFGGYDVFLAKITPASCTPITVSPLTAICAGTTTTVSSSGTGGVWSSSASGVATIDAASGVITGVGAGTATISYVVSGCASSAVTTTISILAAPVITGSSSVCYGFTTTLSASVGGGTWSSGSYIANVDPTSGVVTGSYPGTTSITYSVPGGCSAITTFTVSASPSYISGDAGLCTAGSSYYSSYPSGGTWTSSAPSVATISSTGSLTAVSAGTSVISYTLSSGCAISQTLTVNDAPDTITGTANICIGTTSTLSNSVTGGIWSSSDLAIATVGSGTGIIGGVSAGMATITYSVNAGCYATITTTVGPEAPAAITGVTNLCSGQSVSLSSATAGGTWSSTTPAVATINTAGYLSAIGSGATLVLYTTSTVCGPVSTSVMVNVDQRNNWEWATTGGSTGNDWAGMPNYNSSTIATDSAGNSYITGTINGTATFGSISVSSPSGGPAVFVAKYNSAGNCLWAKSFGGDATSDPYGNEGTSVDLDRNGNCYVTGTFKGSASSTITFGSSSLTGTGLREIFVAKYDASGNELWVRQPSAAGGSNNYAKSIKTDALTGDSYITGYLGSAGVAFGSLAAGTAPGAYAVKYDAAGTALWSVAIGAGNADGLCITDDPSGNSFVSGYLQSTETFATTSGTVSLTAIGTRDVFVAKVNASGGLAWVRQFGGTSSSFYSKYAYAKGIATDQSGNIYLTGDFTQIINFGSTVLTHPAASGTASFVAKLDASGAPVWAAQSAPGANDVSARSIKVNSAGEAFIAGVYAGSVTLGAVALPTYSGYSNAFVAKYDASGNCVWGQQALPSGGAPDLRGISMDYTGNIYVTGNVQYPTDFGCHTTTAYGGYDALIAKLGPSCNALAAVGGTSVCAGSTTTLSDATSGGRWSMIGANATVDATTGEVTGITPGTAAITYTTPSGCRRTTSVTVLAQPAAITGLASLCAGSTITLSTTATGGTWSSSTTSVATVSSARIVTGVTNGTSVISYTLSSGCSRTHTVTVTSLPAITGATAICVGQSATLGNALAGGTWASSHPTIVGVGSASGIATAVSYSATVPTVTYTASGCRVTASVPVNALPGTINGSANVCEGATITLTNATAGGAWSSATPTVASISAGGHVFGATAGTATISYTVSSGCARAITVSVNAMPSAIINAGPICIGSTRTLSNAVSGGVWTSSHPTIANIGSTGVATGISSSSISPTISYTMPGACRATATVTVYALPAGINGPLSVCEGAVVTLSTTTTGGAWSSGTMSVATVGSVLSGNRGEVSGLSAGTSVISYTAASGCARLVTVTVNPSAGSITGQSIMCPGQSVTFTTTATGGAWTSSNPTIASVNSSTGVVTGSTSLFGFPTITYTMPGGCRSTFPTRVASPSAISGPTAVCGGRTITLGNTVTGGSWTSSDASIATVGSTGVVLGGSAGVAVITYELGSGCFRTTTITVNAGPSAINGPGSVCFGSTMTLTNATPGGTWTSSHFTTASIGSTTGIVTGLAASATIPTITYSLGSGCYALRSVSVVFIASIAGPSSVCQGRTITLGNTAPGGTWSSSNGAVASISAAGILAGLAPGTTVISYTIGGGSCAVSRTVTVNPYADITGPSEVCNGSSITLSNALTGGTWASYYVGVATIGSVTGIITTVAPSSVPTTITYTMPGGCTDTALVYVRYLAPITGPTSVCEGTIANLSNIYTGGTWSSSDASVATIGSSTATVSGVTAGVVTLTYNMPSGCFATYTQTVHPAAPAISGPNRVCLGTDITLSNAVSGGTWSVYYPTATIGSTSGIVSGISASSVHNIITYTLPTGCRDTALVEVSSCLRGIAADNDGAEEAGFLLVPNPSRGEFMVKGSFGHNQDQAITIEVTNMLGQVVHQLVADAPGGQLAINVRLDNEPANGMYLVTISAGTDKKVFHVVINR